MRLDDRGVEIECKGSTEHDARRGHVHVDRQLGSDACGTDQQFGGGVIEHRDGVETGVGHDRGCDDAASQRNSRAFEAGDAHGPIELWINRDGGEHDLLVKHGQREVGAGERNRFGVRGNDRGTGGDCGIGGGGAVGVAEQIGARVIGLAQGRECNSTGGQRDDANGVQVEALHDGATVVAETAVIGGAGAAVIGGAGAGEAGGGAGEADEANGTKCCGVEVEAEPLELVWRGEVRIRNRTLPIGIRHFEWIVRVATDRLIQELAADRAFFCVAGNSRGVSRAVDGFPYSAVEAYFDRDVGQSCADLVESLVDDEVIGHGSIGVGDDGGAGVEVDRHGAVELNARKAGRECSCKNATVIVGSVVGSGDEGAKPSGVSDGDHRFDENKLGRRGAAGT